MNPLATLVKDSKEYKPQPNDIYPLWNEKDRYTLFCYISTSFAFKPISISELYEKGLMIWERQNLTFRLDQVDIVIDVDIISHSNQSFSSTLNQSNSRRKIFQANDVFWNKVNQNQSNLFLHVMAVSADWTESDFTFTKADVISGKLLHGSISMIKYDSPPKSFFQRYLLQDISLFQSFYLEQNQKNNKNTSFISYWKPEVIIKFVADDIVYPRDYVPKSMMNQIVPKKVNGRFVYKPVLYVDEMGLTSDKYIPLSSDTSYLALKLSIGTISLQRWLFGQSFEESLRNQKDFGFQDSDIDDVRRLITSTSIPLLLITFIASLLHLIFEALAFRSDITFWQSTNDTTGLSTRVVMAELVTQIIVLLFLMNTDASLLIIVPSAFGIVVQIWKVWRVVKLNQSKTYSSKSIDSNDQEEESRLAKATVEADIMASTNLGLLLFPLLVGYCSYSLLYEKHTSWYSWIIASCTTNVYGIGFIFMCPQLFINYKLKSVARLPWKTMIYRFLNTFIDDLFAFIIKMPTIHRLSVFRDDIVFFIYLYQRWIYSVDISRPLEK